MPKSCAECQFAIQTDAKRFGYICQLNFTGVFIKDTKPSWCLLKPVKEEESMEINNFILIRHSEFEQSPTVEGYFASVQDAKDYARLTFPEDAISIYELVANAKDLVDED